MKPQSARSGASLRDKTFSDSDIREAFQAIDLDKNMYIGFSEIKHVLSLMGEQASSEEIDAMIRLCDTDGTGLVSFDGFMRLFSSNPAPSITRATELVDSPPTFSHRQSSDHVDSGGTASISDLIREFSRGIDISPSYIRKLYKKFQVVDTARAGLLGFQEFSTVLEPVDSFLARRIFDAFDFYLNGEIDVKQFLVCLIINSDSIRSSEKLKISFSMMRTPNCPDHSIDLEGLTSLLTTYFSGLPDESAKMPVVQRVDAVFRISGSEGTITFDQFMDVVTVNPELVIPSMIKQPIDDF